jgi:pilus assembly protein CpaF
MILPFLRLIEPLLLDDSISESMGNPYASWWYERDGILRLEQSIPFDAGRLRTGPEVIANQLGRKLDEDNAVLQVELPDGSRLAAVIPPVVRPAPALTIRKFTSRHYKVDGPNALSTLTRPLAEFLAVQIAAGKTLLIRGRTSMGKTAPLRILADAIPTERRIVVIEDTPELHLKRPNLLAVERQTDTFKTSISFDDLLKSVLRWRPDRIILHEVRGNQKRTLLDSLNPGYAVHWLPSMPTPPKSPFIALPIWSCGTMRRQPLLIPRRRSQRPSISSCMSNVNRPPHHPRSLGDSRLRAGI